MNRLASWLIERAPGFEPAYRRRIAIDKIRTLALAIQRDVLIVALHRRVRNEFIERVVWLLRGNLVRGIDISRDQRDHRFGAQDVFRWLYREPFEPIGPTLAASLTKFSGDRWIGRLFRADILADINVAAVEHDIVEFYRKIATDFAAGIVDHDTVVPFIVSHFGLTREDRSTTTSGPQDILRQQHFDLPRSIVEAMIRKRNTDQRYRGVDVAALERLAEQAFELAVQRFDPASSETFRLFALKTISERLHRILDARRDLDEFFRGFPELIRFDFDGTDSRILAAARQAGPEANTSASTGGNA